MKIAYEEVSDLIKLVRERSYEEELNTDEALDLLEDELSTREKEDY